MTDKTTLRRYGLVSFQDGLCGWVEIGPIQDGKYAQFEAAHAIEQERDALKDTIAELEMTRDAFRSRVSELEQERYPLRQERDALKEVLRELVRVQGATPLGSVVNVVCALSKARTLIGDKDGR